MNDVTGDPAMEDAVKWARLYATSCQDTLAAANACLDVANKAVGARDVANQRPQAEMSIQTFMKMAEQAEDEFIPLYRAFAEACSSTRDTAEGFLSAQAEHDPEIVLALNVQPDVLNDVATAKAILLANFGSTPAGFVEGIGEVNAILKDPFPQPGNIYAPSGSGPS